MAGEPQGCSQRRENSGDVREREIWGGRLLVWVCDGFMEVHTALDWG